MPKTVITWQLYQNGSKSWLLAHRDNRFIAYAINIKSIPDLRYNLTSCHLNKTIIFYLCITWPHWNKFTNSCLKLIQNIWDMFSRLMSNILKYQFSFWSAWVSERQVDFHCALLAVLIHFWVKRKACCLEQKRF